MKSKVLTFDPGVELYQELNLLFDKDGKKKKKRDVIIDLINKGLRADDMQSLITQLRIENSELKRILISNNKHVVRTNMFLNEFAELFLDTEKYKALRGRVRAEFEIHLQEQKEMYKVP